jgi:pimeloyl-ACP methyl ester carboxylesterase
MWNPHTLSSAIVRVAAGRGRLPRKGGRLYLRGLPMARTRWWWIPTSLFTLAVWLAAVPVEADPAGSPVTTVNPLDGTPIRSVMLRMPQGALTRNEPLQVLLALHGMGGNGADFSRDLTEQADRYEWLIVAPTIEYGDWTNPAVVAQEDPVLIQALSAYTEQLPQLIGAPVHHKLLILGHSRGAQLAHRFAEFQPQRVLAVAAISAGTYTMPETTAADGNLNFPYGVRDMQRYAGHAFDRTQFDDVSLLVGVGGQDTNPADVPHQWDGVEGTNRLQRAQAFEAAAEELGAHAVLRVFGNAHHELTGEMRSAACEFLESASYDEGG